MNQPIFVREKEAAALLSVTRKSLQCDRQRYPRNRFPFTKIGSGVFYRVSDLAGLGGN